MTARECDKRVRQQTPPQEAAPAAATAKAETCGICGQKIGGGPKLVYMPEIDGQLREVRVCPFCFLKVVSEVRA